MNEILFEGFRVTFPHLSGLMKIKYIDPRTVESAKIHTTREGKYSDKTKNVYNGTYIIYSLQEVPNKYIGVFVHSGLKEDDDNKVRLVALDGSKQKVLNRIRYRNRVANKL